MTSRNEARQAWAKVIERLQPRGEFWFGITGDGSGADTCDVDGRPGWAWVRMSEKQDRATQVMNWMYPGAQQGMPVVVGRRYSHDKHYQILGLNVELYYQHATTGDVVLYNVPHHGPSHTAGTGGDPAPIVIANIVNGMCHETDPRSLAAYVETMIYDYGSELRTWPGGNIDLTAYVPGAANTHTYVVVCINPVTNTLAVVPSVTVPLPIAPSLPDIPVGYYPSGAVLLVNGMTEISNEDIYDYRIAFNAVGGYTAEMNRRLGMLESALQWQIDEQMALIQALLMAVVDAESELDRQISVHIVTGGG